MLGGIAQLQFCDHYFYEAMAPLAVMAAAALYPAARSLRSRASAFLTAALVLAQQGDAKGLFALADDYYDSFSYDAYTTISCNDIPAGGLTDASIQATAAQWATAYPMFGLWNAASLFSFEGWQPTRPPLPAGLPGAGGQLGHARQHGPRGRFPRSDCPDRRGHLRVPPADWSQ